MNKHSDDQNNQLLVDEDTRSRRDFLRSAGKVAVAVPAAALLLAAHSKPARANNTYHGDNGECCDPQ